MTRIQRHGLALMIGAVWTLAIGTHVHLLEAFVLVMSSLELFAGTFMLIVGEK